MKEENTATVELKQAKVEIKTRIDEISGQEYKEMVIQEEDKVVPGEVKTISKDFFLDKESTLVARIAADQLELAEVRANIAMFN